MNNLDPANTSLIQDRTLAEALILAVHQGQNFLTWSSSQRQMIAGESAFEFPPMPGSLLRRITGSVAKLADLDDRRPLRGQFGLIIENGTVVVEVRSYRRSGNGQSHHFELG